MESLLILATYLDAKEILKILKCIYIFLYGTLDEKKKKRKISERRNPSSSFNYVTTSRKEPWFILSLKNIFIRMNYTRNDGKKKKRKNVVVRFIYSLRV